jgi:hypothetical protein
MSQIERGSRILVAYADAEAGENARDQGLAHAACMAVIERSAMVTTVFTVVGKQVLHARPAYRDSVDTDDGTPPSIAQLLEVAANPDSDVDAYWSDWTVDYDYVYILFTQPNQENPDPTRLTTKFASERFALYRILPPETKPADSPEGEAGAQVAKAGPPRSRQRPVN